MQKRFFSVLGASLFISLLPAACGNNPTENTGDVVFGVRSKLTPGIAMDALQVIVKSGGEVVVNEKFEGSNIEFPSEFRVENVPDGDKVEAEIDAFFSGNPVLSRLASTQAIGGRDILLELELEASCLQAPGSSAPTCDAPGTCIHGVCANSAVNSQNLPDYDPNWADQTVDICKPQGAGDPLVIVGEGQADYLPVEDGQVAQVEAGPQGGHHIWIALRVKNLTQAGSITSLTGHFPDLGYDVGPFNVIFTFDPDEGDYCKIYGLRFQLDAEHAIEEMLGKTFEITATITDKDGDIGIGKRSVKLSDSILGG
ncbi:MAG: hypothetical protein IPK82_08990 [Polyangiaceae bacterium]|nr:hypothetical protein [Polyangiaceae bacterium]